MAFQDKSSSHDAPIDPRQAMVAAGVASIPLISIGKLRIRAHYSFLIIAAIAVLPLGDHFPMSHRAVCMGMLAAMVVLHELAHYVFARRIAFGEPIILWPLGGLGDPGARRRPLPTFAAYLAGPFFNALVCGACAVSLFWMHSIVVPFRPDADFAAPGLTIDQPAFYLWYLYVVSFAMLALNLLPALPLDGGHLLQTALWPFMGYGRSMLAASAVGIATSAILSAYAVGVGQWLLLIAMVMCLTYGVRRGMAIKAAGTWSLDEFDEDVAKSRRRRRKLSRYRKWRARRQIRLEESDQSKLDDILGKIHDRGLRALSWTEKRVLRRATERQRRSELP